MDILTKSLGHQVGVKIKKQLNLSLKTRDFMEEEGQMMDIAFIVQLWRYVLFNSKKFLFQVLIFIKRNSFFDVSRQVVWDAY